MIWFEIKLKYSKIVDAGKEKKITESYIVDAISWTESEARIIREMESYVNNEFDITSIKKVEISEIFASENSEHWYKIESNIISIDENKGKEKESKQTYLVLANKLEEALFVYNENMQNMIIPFEIISIKKTNIINIFPYLENDENT